MDASSLPFRGRGVSLNNEFETRRRRVSIELHAVDKLISDANAALRKSSSSVQSLGPTPTTPTFGGQPGRMGAPKGAYTGGDGFDATRRRVSLDIRSVEDAIHEHMHARAVKAAARDGNVLSPNPLHGRKGSPSLKRKVNAAGGSTLDLLAP